MNVEKRRAHPLELKIRKESSLTATVITEKLSHSYVCKPVYLKIYRRRYKVAGQREANSSTYDLTLRGVKLGYPKWVFF